MKPDEWVFRSGGDRGPVLQWRRGPAWWHERRRHTGLRIAAWLIGLYTRKG